jgi:glycosyltransferase involved in cell wall biosynthesis
MKLILYIGSGIPHKKNYEALKRMCASIGIAYEETADIGRLKSDDYHIFMSPYSYIDPSLIHPQVKIIYGPQFFVIPSGPIVGKLNPELSKRAVFNSLSTWVKNFYLECAHNCIVPIKEFPYSVDIEKFKPLNCNKELDCIVYIKRRASSIINTTMSILNSKGINYKVFIYGSYNEGDYLNALRSCKFLLSLDAHESQGFALEEAMSCNVPLLVLDATSMYDETNDGCHYTYECLRPKQLLATSVPYWSDECGIKITDVADLSATIDRMMVDYSKFTPRKYILRELSDEVCMKRILDYFKL